MDLCEGHAGKVGKSGWHGKGTGEIPEDKLKEFERNAAKSSGTGEMTAGGGGGGALTRLRRAGFALAGEAEGGGGDGGRAGGSEAQIGQDGAGEVAGRGDVMASVEEGTDGGRVVVDGAVRGGSGGRISSLSRRACRRFRLFLEGVWLLPSHGTWGCC